MASSTAHSPSRLPLPVKSSPTPTHIPISGIYMKDLIVAEHLQPSLQQTPVSHSKENGNVKPDPHLAQGHKGKGFETFLLTGEIIIHNKPTVTHAQVKQDSDVKRESLIPRLGQADHKQTQHAREPHAPPHQSQGVISSPKLHSKIPGPVKNHQLHNSVSHQKHSSSPPQDQHVPGQARVSPAQDMNQHVAVQVREFPFIHAPVAEMEELSDLSQSSCSESELGLDNDSDIQSPSLPVSPPPHPSTTETSRLVKTAGDLYKLQQLLPMSSSAALPDPLLSEPPSSGDSGYVHDGHISDPDLANREFVSSDNTLSNNGNFFSDETLTDRDGVLSADNINTNIGSAAVWPGSSTSTAGSSAEKYTGHGSNTDRLLVRTSKSHENYLQAGTNVALVSIDIEDNLAYSLDTLTYHDSPNSSSDNVATEPTHLSRSLDNSPEKKSEKSSTNEREFMPGFINVEDSRPVKLKLTKQDDDANGSGNFYTDFMTTASSFHGAHSSGQNKSIRDSSRSTAPNSIGWDSLQLGDDVDDEGLYHQPSKAVDRPSAERLAKRLFFLEGFRKSDVSRHLCKKNDFSNLVAEEYLKFFDLQEDTLDLALRKFLLRFSLYGETQERERVLAHFSHRFMECNSGCFHSEDACHTLTCAIMLLNSDLHSPNVGRRMTCQEFIDNLAELNDGDNFSKEVLKAIYQAIKGEPIEWAVDDVIPEPEGTHIAEQMGPVLAPATQAMGSNPFLEVPDPNKTTEYKKGYVMRKCCMEPDRRRTPFGKRGWKMLYAVLRDMILYQYKDEHQLKKGHFVESTHNVIRIHHSLATKALDYTKKQHVFRLQTADWAEYLFQTGDSKELQEWVDTLNLVAASMSAPVLSGAVGSRTKFQRQLLPSLCTRLNLREQHDSHESRVHELEQDLHLHRTAAPEKGAKSSVIQDYLEKESYLEFEIKRFKTYAYLLQGKLSAFPELEPSLVETTIGEYEEMGASPPPNQMAVFISAAKPVNGAHRVKLPREPVLTEEVTNDQPVVRVY